MKLKRKALILQILLLALSAVLLTATAFAWIPRLLDGGGIGFTTGGAPFSVMTFNPTTGAWENRFGNSEINVSPTQSTAADGSVTVSVNDLNFGTMDNVTVLNDGNKVYIRFDKIADNIPAAATSAALKVTCGTADYKIFDKNASELSRSATATKPIYDNINSLENLAFLECLVCADAADLMAADALKTAFANSAPTTVSAKPDAAGNTGATLAVDTLPQYIYVCLQPNLDSYKQIVKQLGTYMPCYMTFNVQIECYPLTAQEPV